MSPSLPRFPSSAAAAAVLAAAVGCTPGGGPDLPAPSPSGRAAAVCRALHGFLPDRVVGQERIASPSGTEYTAAWGDPAIELGCGVARPELLAPGSEHYNPTADAVEVNGVSWLLEKHGDGHLFTTTDRTVYVRVAVPGAYAPEVNALVDLADAVRSAVPEKTL